MIRDVANEIERMSASEWMGVIGGIFGFMLLIIIVSLIIIKAKQAQNAACPTQQMKARVVDKERLPTNAIPAFSTMWVLFELDNGIRKRMVISATKDNMVVGDTGMLVWQGDALISFDRNISTTNQSGAWNSGAGTRGNSSVGTQGYIPAWKRVEMGEVEINQHSQPEKTEQSASEQCIFCGAELSQDQVFCGKCGRRRD